jgi:hypothetical protein
MPGSAFFGAADAGDKPPARAARKPIFRMMLFLIILFGLQVV